MDAVKWTKSSNHARCIKCRKKSLPEQMLLCDECNAGMHMFCMEPKLDVSFLDFLFILKFSNLTKYIFYFSQSLKEIGIVKNVL